ncbi:MAG: hypothetical protein F4041_16740 [Acidobacteriia bacterium]|nr:hypothetical protein [Terriglobia bacterium]
MSIGDIAALLGVLARALKELGSKTSAMQSKDLEFHICDYSGERPGEGRLVCIDLRGESLARGLIAAVETLGPRRFLRRKRYLAALRGPDPAEWAERLAFKFASDRVAFQLHDDVPSEFIVRVHACGAFNGRRAWRDEPYETIADKLGW